MEKSFQFASVDDVKTARQDIKLVINDTAIQLADDLTGIELLEAIARTDGSPGTARGALAFLRRVIIGREDAVRSEEQIATGLARWEQFGKLTTRATPSQLGNLVSEVIDAYASFPTTQDSDSLNGHTPTGSMSESN